MAKIITSLAVAAAALTLVAGAAEAREGRVVARGQNGAAAAAAGPNGGAGVRARGCVENEAGGTSCASGGAARGPNGGRGARASTTTVNPDGSATRRGGFVAETPAGAAVASSGSTTRNADGTVTGSRSTSATGADGSTYSGATSYDPATGVTRTTTCTDAAGAAVACPR